MNKNIRGFKLQPLAIAAGLVASGIAVESAAHGYVSEPAGRPLLCPRCLPLSHQQPHPQPLRHACRVSRPRLTLRLGTEVAGILKAGNAHFRGQIMGTQQRD